MILRIIRASLPLSLLFLSGCGGGGSNEGLSLEFSGLQRLHNGFHYEGWAIIDGKPVSTGKFNVDDDGESISVTRELQIDQTSNLDLSEATDIVITIEPTGDTDQIPAQTKILGGSVVNGQAVLTTAHPATLGTNFGSATGTFVLATPTNDDETDELAGLWFIDLSASAPQRGLTLPSLPAGWVFEGWAVINGVPVSTGTFSSADGADSAAPFSGAKQGPAFPGEDFLVNPPTGLTFPADLRGGTAVITVEPSPDDSELPFSLKPLLGSIPENAVDHSNISLENRASDFPVGVATIRLSE